MIVLNHVTRSSVQIRDFLLRIQLEEVTARNDELEKFMQGGTSRVEQLQMESLAQKSKEISNLSEIARSAAERISAAEHKAKTCMKEAEVKEKKAEERRQAMQKEIMERQDNEVALTARLAALERHIAKRNEEVENHGSNFVG